MVVPPPEDAPGEGLGGDDPRPTADDVASPGPEDDTRPGAAVCDGDDVLEGSSPAEMVPPPVKAPLRKATAVADGTPRCKAVALETSGTYPLPEGCKAPPLVVAVRHEAVVASPLGVRSQSIQGSELGLGKRFIIVIIIDGSRQGAQREEDEGRAFEVLGPCHECPAAMETSDDVEAPTVG